MRIRATVAAVVLSATVVGCKTAAPPTIPLDRFARFARDAKRKIADGVAEISAIAAGLDAGIQAATEDDRTALFLEKYEQLLVNLVPCNVTREGFVDHKCEGYKAFLAAENQYAVREDWARDFAVSRSLGMKHITHASPAVRAASTKLLRLSFNRNDESLRAVLSAATQEKHPAVLSRMISAIGLRVETDPGIAAFVLKTADHPDESVRLAAATFIASRVSVGVRGALDKAIERIQNDPSPSVRRRYCLDVHWLADEKAVDALEQATQDHKNGVYAKCLEGLANMWNAILGNEKPSERAYQLTMKRMWEKPRNDLRPPWTLMRFFGRQPRGNPPWYIKGAVVIMLADVAKNTAAHWMARVGAIESMSKLGAAKEIEQVAAVLARMREKGDGAAVLYKARSYVGGASR